MNKNDKNRPEPLPFEIYRHFKGKTYQILNLAIHSETGERLVIYQALYGGFNIYARPLEMFLSEVDRAKYPEIKEKYRFTRIEELSNDKPQISAPEEAVFKTSAAEVPTAPASDAHALFINFLDEDNFEKKRLILKSIYGIATDSMINNMAASLDLVPSDNGREATLKMIDDYVRARIHFDGLRLRD